VLIIVQPAATRDDGHGNGVGQLGSAAGGRAATGRPMGRADQLLARAEAGRVELLHPDEPPSQATNPVLEQALAEQLTEHLALREARSGQPPVRQFPQRGDAEAAVDRGRRGPPGGPAGPGRLVRPEAGAQVEPPELVV
jgi:hypothetical protein